MQRNLSRLLGQLGTLLCIAGFVVMFLGWNGAATYTFIPAQIPYLISGGVVGLGLVMIGATILILQHLRTERARIEAAIDRLAAAVQHQSAGTPAREGVETEDYVLAGTDSYHRVGCTLPESSDEAYLIRLDEAATRDLAPCRVCQPPEAGQPESGAPASAQPFTPLLSHDSER